MATKVVMEALSPTMEEGRLVKWLKNEGDKIASGETLAEVETDKAVMELVARGEGVLRKRLLAEGATAPIGQLVAVIAAPDENIDALVGGAATPPAKEAKPAEEAVAATQENAGASSVPRAAEQSQGEASTPPQQKVPAYRMGSAAPKGQAPPSPTPATEQPRDGGNGEGRARTSPLARRLARERGLDLQNVRGTGPGGRIIKRDIEAAVAGGGAEAPGAAVPRAAAPAREGDFVDVPLTQMRKTIARRLSESLGPIPTFYLTAELDMERVAEMRAAMLDMGEEF